MEKNEEICTLRNGKNRNFVHEELNFFQSQGGIKDEWRKIINENLSFLVLNSKNSFCSIEKTFNIY
jgi:hypothetical protein